MPRIQAIVNMPFGSEIKQKGEQFDATDQEANVLIALKRARLVVEEKAVPARIETRQQVAEPAVPTPNDQPAKRAYKRRDMKAES